MASSTGFLSELAGDLQRAAGAAERIAHLLDAQAVMPQPATPQPINLYSPLACQFDHVDFASGTVNQPDVLISFQHPSLTNAGILTRKSLNSP